MAILKIKEEDQIDEEVIEMWLERTSTGSILVKSRRCGLEQGEAQFFDNKEKCMLTSANFIVTDRYHEIHMW